jgi:hypothetical protein
MEGKQKRRVFILSARNDSRCCIIEDFFLWGFGNCTVRPNKRQTFAKLVVLGGFNNVVTV